MGRVDKMELSESVGGKISSKLDGGTITDWVKTMPDINFDIPMHAGLWVSDPFSNKGYSGAAVIRLNKNLLLCHAPSSWTRLAESKSFVALFHLPIQETERRHIFSEDDVDISDNCILLRLKFVDFELTKDGARLGKFSILDCEKSGEETLKKITKVLAFRQEAYFLLKQKKMVEY
jgi:hypothetical protein